MSHEPWMEAAEVINEHYRTQRPIDATFWWQWQPVKIAEIIAKHAPASRNEGLPDDLREQGWSVAVHNDYKLAGVSNTFWLMTKGNECIKGEGFTDADALNEIRRALQSRPPATEPQRDPYYCGNCGHHAAVHSEGGTTDKCTRCGCPHFSHAESRPAACAEPTKIHNHGHCSDHCECEMCTTAYEQLRGELRERIAWERDGFWKWQGDEFDHPESLTCHVVMTADQVREFVALRAAYTAMRDLLLDFNLQSGWRGNGANDRNDFYCEFCGATHEDYTQIPHSQNCLVTRLRAALALANEVKL